MEPESIRKLKQQIKKRDVGSRASPELEHAIDNRSFEVVIAIITHKPEEHMANNLPLFSRLSLRRNLKALQARRIPVSFGFIKDECDRTNSTKST